MLLAPLLLCYVLLLHPTKPLLGPVAWFSSRRAPCSEVASLLVACLEVACLEVACLEVACLNVLTHFMVATLEVVVVRSAVVLVEASAAERFSRV